MKTRSAILVTSLILALCMLAQVSANCPSERLVSARSVDVEASSDLSWHVIAGGGGRIESAGHALLSTVGQPLVGAASSSDHALCSGFRCPYRRLSRLPRWLYFYHRYGGPFCARPR